MIFFIFDKQYGHILDENYITLQITTCDQAILSVISLHTV